MSTLAEIEQATKEYADARKVLAKRVEEMKDEQERIKRKHLPAIRRILEGVTSRYHGLRALIEENKGLFLKPRTAVFHGVKVGFQKGKGKLTWDDDDTVVRLIGKHFPDRVDDLIITKLVPSRAALAHMMAGDLKKLGVVLTGDEDEILIKSTDSEIDRFVDRLLKDGEEETGEAVA